MKIEILPPGHMALRAGLVWESVPNFAVLTGPNGSGKTQLLRLIDTLYNWRPREKGAVMPAISIQGASLQPGDVAFAASEVSLSSSRADLGTLHQRLNEVTGQLRNPEKLGSNDENHFYSRRRTGLLAPQLETILGRSHTDASESEIRGALPYTFALSTKYESNSLSGELSLVFFTYHIRMRDRIVDFRESEGEAQAALGRPPWETFDLLLEAFGLPFRCSRPAGTSFDSYVLMLWDSARSIWLHLQSLSSGERALVGLTVWMLSSGLGVLPKLILLDEPDAHLHASLIPRFIDTLNESVVGRLGAKVLMTTHRAETVLRCPEGSLFELARDASAVVQVADRNTTAASLTSAAFTVLSGLRCVLVEDKDDSDFYNLVCQLLLRDGQLPTDPRLAFQPVSYGMGVDAQSGGRTAVKNWVDKLSGSGLASIVHGLVDHDNQPEQHPGIYQISRYSMENYLLDPIVVYVALQEHRCAPQVKVSGDLRPGLEGRISSFVHDDKMAIVRAILDPVATRMNWSTELDREVSYPGGSLFYPGWLLHTKGKDLLAAFRECFGVERAINIRQLRRSYERVAMVPGDLCATLRALSGGG